MATCLHSRADDYILGDAVVTGTAPSTSYLLATLILRHPEMRVRWGSGTVTVTFTLPVARQADLFALPVSNLDSSPTRLTLTNGAGLSQAITIPAMTVDRLPRTAVVDLRVGTPVDATRTHTVWNLVIVGNSVNLVLGGCVWLGLARTVDRNVAPEPQRSAQHHGLTTTNDYGTVYRQNHQTKTEQRTVDFAHATTADRVKLADWYDAGAGAYGDPSLFWLSPTVNDADIGVWQETYGETLDVQGAQNHHGVPLVFDVLSKGKPV